MRPKDLSLIYSDAEHMIMEKSLTKKLLLTLF